MYTTLFLKKMKKNLSLEETKLRFQMMQL